MTNKEIKAIIESKLKDENSTLKVKVTQSNTKAKNTIKIVVEDYEEQDLKIIKFNDDKYEDFSFFDGNELYEMDSDLNFILKTVGYYIGTRF